MADASEWQQEYERLVDDVVEAADEVGRACIEDSGIDDAVASLARARAALDAHVARLVEALERIAAVGYGLDMSNTDAERARYWAGEVERLRFVARRALRGDQP